MRKSAFAGLLLCAIIFATTSPRVHAQSADSQIPVITNANQVSLTDTPDIKLAAFSQLAKVTEQLVTTPTVPDSNSETEPQPVKHIAAEGETLSSIAEAHKVTWQQLFYKNTDIADPNTITVGQTVIVPDASEALTPRPIPQPVVATTTVHTNAQAGVSASAQVSRGSSAGNTYAYGYCTWYAKNRRPDLPNNLGNAITWVQRAAAQGIPTGSTPRVGAIGQAGNHVVYVEAVNGDGTITISEMNGRAGWGNIDTIVVSASSYMYIY